MHRTIFASTRSRRHWSRHRCRVRAVGDERIREFIRHKQPLDGGRIGMPSDLDEAAVFFLSDASRYVTGQVLAVDGGWSVSEGVPRDVTKDDVTKD